MSATLSPDWVVGVDGVRFRSAARVLVLDPMGRMLLVRGHDADQPGRSWWFTVGGGIAGGESAIVAAARELREETGIVVPPGALQGPIAIRDGLFHFYAESCRQHEVFFLLRLATTVVINRAGWTAQERELLDELAWLTPQQLRDQAHEYFPRELPDIAEALTAGWDGAVALLGEQDDELALR